ncbi:MAG: T9SS C-terminal target domain-containing protein, partial [Bacteroidetes bacterium]
LQHTILNEQSILHFFPTEDLVPGNIYTVYVAEGLSDMFFNETEAFSYQFLLLDQPVTQTTVIDNFNTGIVNWWHPDQAGQTLGIIPELTYRVNNTTYVNHSVSSLQSMELGYGWDMGFSGIPYIRQYLPPTASQNQNRFNIDNILQVYVYGDGSNNEFRLVIRDGLNQLEAQQWITIDWMGWKLVSWDLANDPVFGWVNGNGELNGANFYMDGFHLRYAEGGAESGKLYFDHLHFVKREEVQYPTTLFENWQDYDDFTTELFPWITVDVEGDVTWNPQGFTFPGSGEPYAFKVMNPAETTPPINGNHPAVDGDKYLIAMMSQATDENKWLISPQLKATDVTQLSFYAKSIETNNFGPERIRVLISLDDDETFQFDPDNFIVISDGEYIEVPGQWTQYQYYLGDHAGEVYRFAIQYVSHDDYMLMLDKFEVGAAQTYALTLTAEPSEGGQATGAGDYAAGQEVTVTATPATGFAFHNWVDADGNEMSTSATYTFSMPGNDLSLTAHFVPATYNLVLKVSPEDAGTTQGEGSYFFNEEVTVSTTANDGFEFLHWRNRDGDIMSDEQEYTFPMPAMNNFELTAVYQEIPQFYTVTLTAQPEEGGAVYGEGTYEAGETIYTTAAPADNYIFLRWTNEENEEVSTNTMYSFMMPAEDIALIAHFQLETGIDIPAGQGIKIFPNPARSQINIESDYFIDYITVTDITGRNVATVRVDDYLHTFETGNYPRGLYLLRIQTEKGTLYKKIQIIE